MATYALIKDNVIVNVIELADQGALPSLPDEARLPQKPSEPVPQKDQAPEDYAEALKRYHADRDEYEAARTEFHEQVIAANKPRYTPPEGHEIMLLADAVQDQRVDAATFVPRAEEGALDPVLVTVIEPTKAELLAEVQKLQQKIEALK